jgi:2-polyprenyl-6-methoxyphenol hydroxylase-like FAD-dependent oxidoreductase
VTRFLNDFRRLTSVPQGPALADGTPIGPCATYGGENTWTEQPFGPGVVLIGDAAGYSSPIVGQGLSMSLRDVRQVAELILDGADFVSERAMPYAEQRRERLRRAHFLADLWADIYMTFGAEGAARRGRIYQRLQNPEDPAAMCIVPILLGPDRTPDWAYTDAFRSDLLD